MAWAEAVAVYIEGGKRYDLSGRTAHLVQWLCEAADLVQRPQVGTIEIRFRGETVSVQINAQLAQFDSAGARSSRLP